VLRFLSSAFADTRPDTTLLGAPAWTWWWEVNQVKLLFASNKAWNAQSAAQFINCARSYMEI